MYQFHRIIMRIKRDDDVGFLAQHATRGKGSVSIRLFSPLLPQWPWKRALGFLFPFPPFHLGVRILHFQNQDVTNALRILRFFFIRQMKIHDFRGYMKISMYVSSIFLSYWILRDNAYNAPFAFSSFIQGESHPCECRASRGRPNWRPVSCR